MRCAIYARVSTIDRGQDVENQLLQLREYAARQGWEISREYVDQASGKSANGRHEFLQMLTDAKAKRFDALLVWALDRLTREGIEKTFGYVRQLADSGVTFHSFTEPQFSASSPCWDLMLSIAAWIAKQERKRISERTKAGLGRKRGHNIWDHEAEIKALKGQMTVRKAAEFIQGKYSLTQSPHATIWRIWNQTA